MASRLGTQVLVIGAGPTGLLLAAELERREVSCLLIDELDAPRTWDRATVVHPRSMEIFESLGIADQFLERGVKTRAARFHSGGESLGLLDIGLSDSRYDFDLGISEEVTESILTAHLERLGGAVTRSTRLVGLREESDGILATLERNGERSEVAASWVVGCDGLHSAVRDLVGIEFGGNQIQASWAVFDAGIEGWDEEFDVAAAYLDVPAVILTPLPGRRWRVYLRPTSDSSDLVSDAEAAIHPYKPGVRFAEIENPTRFHCHSRVAESFRSGRALLAGDAAHVCSPAEGHGMNSGLQDAFNLGWKLALVCQGVSDPSLLDSYDAERRPVAMRVVESGEAAEAAQAISADDKRAARDAEIRRTYADPESAHHEAVAAAELDRCYAGSFAVTGDENGRLGPGDRLPDSLRVHGPDGEPTLLHQLTHHPGHTLLALGAGETSADEVVGLLNVLGPRLQDSPLVDQMLGLSTDPSAPQLGELDPAVAEQLGIDRLTVLAVRPDRYVGLRHDGADPTVVTTYFEALSN